MGNPYMYETAMNKAEIKILEEKREKEINKMLKEFNEYIKFLKSQKGEKWI